MDDTPDWAVAPCSEVLPESEPVSTVADVRAWQASADRRGLSSAAAAVLRKTFDRWELIGEGEPFTGRIVPLGDWLRCPVDGGRPVLRYWAYHRRPGNPTIPYRCDVGFKCSDCAFGWWHGVAIPGEWWAARPLPVGLRKVLSAGSVFEPRVWASDRGVKVNG